MKNQFTKRYFNKLLAAGEDRLGNELLDGGCCAREELAGLEEAFLFVSPSVACALQRPIIRTKLQQRNCVPT